MRTLFFLLSIYFLSNFSFAQPFCQDQQQHAHKVRSQFKSGNESLRSDTINVLNYDIYLDFTEATTGILKASCEVKFTPLMDATSLSLDLLQLTVDSIVMHNNSIPFSYNDSLIVAQFGTTINTGEIDSLIVYYHGSPQTDPSGWGGFYMTSGYYYNLGVGFASDPHNYGRVWHPCFDNFVERATYHFNVLTNNGNTAYCNGTRTNVQVVGTDSLLTTWNLQTEIPSYLASVAVSSYTHVSQVYNSTLQGIQIPAWLAAKPSDTTNLKNSFIHLMDAMEGYENYYGPYHWERIGYVLVPFNAGAMEHATNIAYPLLTVNGSLTYETLMAHELSHHWWGDWVTCETAEEMWINEGMASYSERLFLEWVYGYTNYMTSMRDNHYKVLHLAHINDEGYYALDAVPVEFTYGDHSYKKGADVMHTLRSYMGDADFFAGLKEVLNEYGGSHLSSLQYMQELNTLAGVDVTDFFNDWIFQAGFSHFSVSNFTSVVSGGNYDVQVLVDQKLKGGATFHNNVPLQITFIDATWNVHTEQIVMSGSDATFSFTIPINPVFVGINLDERINDATTAITETLTTTGTKLWSYANARLVVSTINDSSMIRIEHNWVAPDATGLPDNVLISPDRYWNIHGVDLDNITGNLRFEFNAKPLPTGNFDNGLLIDWGGDAFIEDSLVLLYRPNASSNWQIHSDFSINYVGSHTDKGGFLTANTFATGQYAFGYRTDYVNLADKNDSDRTYSIYPNPAVDSINIDLRNWDAKELVLSIYGIEGKLALHRKIQGGQINLIETNLLGNGTYIVLIQNENDQTLGSKRIVVSR